MLQKAVVAGFVIVAAFTVYFLFPGSSVVETPVVQNAEEMRVAEPVGVDEADSSVPDQKPTSVAVSKPSPPPSIPNQGQDIPNQNDDTHSTPVIWSSREGVWSPSGTPPTCPEPLVLQTPVDMRMVTMALWPGQVRGQYKAHGGFRFDNEGPNTIEVRAPIGAHLVQASRYLESGEDQYLLFFSVPCGFFYRFDHVRIASSKIEKALQILPPPTNDSRTTFIHPPVWIETGEIIGASIGVTNNIFVDFGLYDLRQRNNVVPNPEWTALYEADKEFGHFGVCFFDYLPASDGATMRALPTGKEGKTSDYCTKG